MAKKTGAGAAVSAGANFQARTAAYLIVTSICDVESKLGPAGDITSFSFETFEAVDDLNVSTQAGDVFIQAKAKIDFSLAAEGELRSVLTQFERQHAANSSPEDRYLLVTTNRSSQRVTGDLRAALEAFRTSDAKAFYRDQPKAIIEVISSAKATLEEIAELAGQQDTASVAEEILRKSQVVILDVEAGGALEEGLTLLLAARDYLAPSAVWGAIIADCVEHARARRTFTSADALRRYKRYKRISGSKDVADGAEDLMRLDLSEFAAPVEREVILGRLEGAEDAPNGNMVLMELYRFGNDCSERASFDEEWCTLESGARIALVRRAASMAGMNRMLEASPTLTGDDAVTIFPSAEGKNQDESNCVTIHRARLREAIERNEHPLRCLNCASAISSEKCSIVELGPLEYPIVGLVHDDCLRPADRVLGTIRSDFFAGHPELVNFDVEGWVRASENGQRAFRGVEYLNTGVPIVLAWNGNSSGGVPGNWVVETSLTNGDRVIATQRNHVHRFERAAAEAFASDLNRTYDSARSQGDPFCYTNSSFAFGTRSELLKMIGAREKIIPVDRARSRAFDARFAARFERPGNWYAPLLLIRDQQSDTPLAFDGAVMALTDPLALKTHLENWREAGIEVPEYETASVLTDDNFDAFMRSVTQAGQHLIIDPLFDPVTQQILAGVTLVSFDQVKEAAENAALPF